MFPREIAQLRILQILAQEPDISQRRLAERLGVSLGTRKDKTAEYIAALKSRALSMSFIKERNLMPLLHSSQWDGAKKGWKDPASAPSEWETFERWDRDIRFVTQEMLVSTREEYAFTIIDPAVAPERRRRPHRTMLVLGGLLLGLLGGAGAAVLASRRRSGSNTAAQA